MRPSSTTFGKSHTSDRRHSTCTTNAIALEKSITEMPILKCPSSGKQDTGSLEDMNSGSQISQLGKKDGRLGKSKRPAVEPLVAEQFQTTMGFI